MVDALVKELRSPFRGRKPQRREDHKKRTRKSTTNVAAPANTLRSHFGGRKPQRSEARCEGTRTAGERAKNL
jgi:hypothetical protein